MKSLPALILAATACTAWATTTTWIPPMNSFSWDTPSQWTSGVPTSSVDAVIDNTAYPDNKWSVPIVEQGPAQAKSITILQGGVAVSGQTLTTGNITIQPATDNGGYLQNHGVIVAGALTLAASYGPQFNSSADFSNFVSASFSNISATGDAVQIWNDSKVTTSGNFTLGGGAGLIRYLRGTYSFSGASYDVGGSFSLTGSAYIDLVMASTPQLNPLFNITGTLDFTQATTLTIDVSSWQLAQPDFSYTLFTAGNITGDLSAIKIVDDNFHPINSLAIERVGNTVNLVYSAVPEPTNLAILGILGVAVSLVYNRRKTVV